MSGGIVIVVLRCRIFATIYGYDYRKYYYSNYCHFHDNPIIFLGRSDKCAFTNDTLFAVVGVAFRKTVVFQIVVGNAYGVPIPIVGLGFDVSVVIMLSVQGGQRSFLVYPYRKCR